MNFVFAILWTALIVGMVARLAIPGPDPMPLWLTLAIGLAGAITGAAVGRAVSHGNSAVEQIVAFAVAIGLVAAYRRYVQKRPIFGAGAMKFPERGIGVEQYRERLRRAGFDPDALRPGVAAPAQAPQPRSLATAIEELHAAGVLDDEEQQALVERLTEPGTDTNVP